MVLIPLRRSQKDFIQRIANIDENHDHQALIETITTYLNNCNTPRVEEKNIKAEIDLSKRLIRKLYKINDIYIFK